MDVKTLCLGVLSRGDCSGYEIRKAFEEGPFAHFQDAGFGSIYPALKKLTDDGAVTCVEQAQEGRPDKKVYRLTAKGRQLLFDAVNTRPGSDKLRSDFLFILFFAELLAPRDLDRLIDDRIGEHRAELECLDRVDRADLSAGERFTLGYGRAYHAAALAYLEDYRHELLGDLLRTPQVAE